MGLVDHKKVGHGTDQAGETTTWYTISLWLLEEDEVNRFAAGETIAYIVDEEDFDHVEAGDVVEGIPQRDLRMDILDVIRRPSSSITWHRNGGLMGLSEELAVAADGSTSYTSNLFGSAELALTKSEVEYLLDKAGFIMEDIAYTAKPGAADYYTYRLTMRTPSGARTVEWVDEWASEDDLPRDLKELQSHMESIVERAHQQTGAWEDADERAGDIAREFIVHAPTFAYDGIPETVNITEIKILESFPVQYVVTITFESGHPGYGDRTGQVLLRVVTSHTAVVKVVTDNVVSAILDGQWDELMQRAR